MEESVLSVKILYEIANQKETLRKIMKTLEDKMIPSDSSFVFEEK